MIGSTSIESFSAILAMYLILSGEDGGELLIRIIKYSKIVFCDRARLRIAPFTPGVA